MRTQISSTLRETNTPRAPELGISVRAERASACERIASSDELPRCYAPPAFNVDIKIKCSQALKLVFSRFHVYFN